MNRRLYIPTKLKSEILYKSANACAICSEHGDQIHHIDKNNKNNDIDNLILLCLKHHGEAHTTRELSQNLTPKKLKEFRKKWYDEVIKKRSNAASHNFQKFNSINAVWGYINHSRVLQTIPPQILEEIDQELFERLKSNNVIDTKGIPITSKKRALASSYIENTIYSNYQHLDSVSLHIFFSELVDEFVKSINLVHLEADNWNRTFIKNMIEPGSFIFLNRAHYFKRIQETNENALVAVKCFAKKIKIKYQINTRNMYGTTSITCSFAGHKSCAALLQVKSIEDQDSERIIHCTPFALGIGFEKRLAS